ncbi:MAG: DUF4062 domain-containing protein [Candidatus Omnitrophica bacterium]|nr:DUF4062 domain-containing protein [Candidatus Omnitrophota bacterium]
MAIPRIFVSSTCYDLKYIRENIKYFVRNLGYEPILSEEGSVYFNPKQHTQDACLAEVPNCQIFVLIIGGRFGERYKGQKVSVTNAEYREAVASKIPIFTLIEDAVYNEFNVYQKNKTNTLIDKTKIAYPSVDSPEIFGFLEEVRASSINNAIVPFKDFTDIEAYLRQQWASMLFYFLTRENGEKRVSDTLVMLTTMNEQIAMLSKQILNSVGTPHAKITAELFEEMLVYECVRDASYFHVKPSPASVLKSNSFLDWIKSLGKEIKIEKRDDSGRAEDVIGSDFVSEVHYKRSEESFNQLKTRLLEILKKHNMSLASYLQGV